MPEVQENETQDRWMARCIPLVLEDGTAEDQKQAAAICMQKYRDAQEEDKRGAARRALAGHTRGVVIKSIDDQQMTVAGYGVVWGGRDLEGDTFTKGTDFWFDRLTERPMVLYQHGRDSALQRRVVGRVSNKSRDSVGLWIEAQLAMSGEYANAIRQLAEAGVLGWSSGAVAHLVDRDPGGYIRSWPIAEFSLTPTPCEPRTLGVQALRSLAEVEPAVKALLSEDAGASADGATEAAAKAKSAEAFLLLTRIDEEV